MPNCTTLQSEFSALDNRFPKQMPITLTGVKNFLTYFFYKKLRKYCKIKYLFVTEKIFAGKAKKVRLSFKKFIPFCRKQVNKVFV